MTIFAIINDFNLTILSFSDFKHVSKYPLDIAMGCSINGHIPTHESALVRLTLAKGLLLAASKLGSYFE